MREVNNLSFPNIEANKPYGTDFVNTIDNYERETRNWLRKCMEEISGYPTCSSIKIEKWPTEGRPTRPVTGVIGYNSTLNSLERYDGSKWEEI